MVGKQRPELPRHHRNHSGRAGAGGGGLGSLPLSTQTSTSQLVLQHQLSQGNTGNPVQRQGSRLSTDTARVPMGLLPETSSSAAGSDAGSYNGFGDLVATNSNNVVVDLAATPAGFEVLPEFVDVLTACWRDREHKRPSAEDVHHKLCSLLAKHGYVAPQ